VNSPAKGVSEEDRSPILVESDAQGGILHTCYEGRAGVRVRYPSRVDIQVIV
jgi:hypothetical protein